MRHQVVLGSLLLAAPTLASSQSHDVGAPIASQHIQHASRSLQEQPAAANFNFNTQTEVSTITFYSLKMHFVSAAKALPLLYSYKQSNAVPNAHCLR
jgi:hypothetical protein